MEFKRAFEGLTVVAVGAVLLANTTGYLPWGVWWSILSLWPVLLIAAGIDVIGKGLDNAWLRALSSLAVIGALAYGAFVMPASGPGALAWNWDWSWGGDSARSVPFALSEPADPTVERGTARIQGGVGELNVTSGSSDLISITGESPFGEPELDVSTDGRSADVNVAYPDGDLTGPGGAVMNAVLAEGVAWDLTLESGVSKTDADLSALDLTKLLVRTGVSETTIVLGEPTAENTPVTLEAGVSSTVVRMPRGVSARVRTDSGLAPTQFADGWDEKDGVRYSPAWSDSGESWDILVKAGISSVRFEWER